MLKPPLPSEFQTVLPPPPMPSEFRNHSNPPLGIAAFFFQLIWKALSIFQTPLLN